MGLPAIESSGRSQDTEVLFREHGAAVARFCRSLLRDHAEAEDAAQQVFLSAHRALLNGSAPREPLPWLLTVARHECYARFRQRQASPVPAGDGHDGATPDASVHVLRARQIATLWDEVERMPRAQRDAFVLREIRGLSYTQLADELALSAASVRSLLVRARTRLRHRLREVAPSIGGAPWIQTLVRLVEGGDGASPVPAATKAAAVGIGALALVGGGDLARVPHHAPRAAGHAAARRQSHPRAHQAATPTPLVTTPVEDHPGRDARVSEVEHSRSRRDGSGESRGGSSGGGSGTSSSSGSSGSGHDGSDDTTAVSRPTTSGRDGRDAGSSSSGSSTSSGSGRDSSHDGLSGSGTSGSISGSDSSDGSSSSSTTTSGSSDGHGSGGSDGGSSGGSSGSDG